MEVMLNIIVIKNDLQSGQGCHMSPNNSDEPEVIRANRDTVCALVTEMNQ